MTLSVGLGRIIPDPDASVLTRKALGVLSNPALIVYDDALTIDGTGRLVLKLNPESGLSQDENGLSVAEILIKPSSGLENTDDGLAVKLKPNTGLQVEADGLSVKLDPSGNISSSAAGLAVSLTSLPWTRWLTATGLVSVVYGTESSDHDITVTGALVGDLVIVAPTSVAPTINQINSWSGRVRATNTVTVRLGLTVGAFSNEAYTFRVLVIGVT